jgi:hypothetical protein
MRSHLATLAVVGLVAASPVLLAGGGSTLTASRRPSGESARLLKV